MRRQVPLRLIMIQTFVLVVALCVHVSLATAQVSLTALPAQANVIGDGYNLLLGNTDGIQWQSGGQDPGIRVARKVLQLETDSEFAAEVSYQSHSSCLSSHAVEVVYSPKSYQAKLLRRITLDGQQIPSLQAAAFTLSPAYHDVSIETSNHHHVLYDKETTCVTGSARYKTSLVQPNGFKLTNEIVVDICALPETNDTQAYTQFIDKWGTHVITEVHLGYRQTERSRLNFSDFVSYVMKRAPSDVIDGGPLYGSSFSYEVDLNSFKTRLGFSDSIGQFYDNLKTGSSASPEPVGLGLTSIDVALSSQYWIGNDDFYQYCQHNITLTLALKKKFLQQALAQYPKTKGADFPPTDTKLAIPVTWPSGEYGLPKPKSGCPGRNHYWQEGWILQNPEMQTPDSNWTNPNHFEGMLVRTSFSLWFCVKTVHSDGLSLEWPRGDYCIFKYNTCPQGFVEGYVQWDDDDTNNANTHGGTLPSGEYGQDTLMRYCCRSDGSIYDPIVLPTDTPFYLFKYKHGCQEVKHMTSSEEFIYWDDDDKAIPSNAAIGSVHPGMKFCNPCGIITGSTIYYCYYTRSDDGAATIIG